MNVNKSRIRDTIITISRLIYQANGALSPQVTVSMQNPIITAATTSKSIVKKMLALNRRIFRSLSEEISSAPTGSLPIAPILVFRLDFML